MNQSLQTLYQFDNYHAILAVLEDYLIIAGAILLYSYSAWFLPLAVLLIGARQRALATLLHESSHLTLAKNRTLNFLLGSVFSGYWVFQTFYTYQCSHVRRHHRYLGDPDRDPDIQHYIKQGLLNRTLTAGGLKQKILRTLLGERTLSNLRYLVLNRLIPLNWQEQPRSAKVEYIVFVFFWSIVLTLLAALGLFWEFVLLWLLPYLTSFQIINWFIELAEHYPLTKDSSYDLQMTRNRLSNFIERFFTGIHNENWHLVHHLKPGLPFWNVGKAHQIMMADQAYAEASVAAGGLFLRGTNGAPSIVTTMIRRLEPQTEE